MLRLRECNIRAPVPFPTHQNHFFFSIPGRGSKGSGHEREEEGKQHERRHGEVEDKHDKDRGEEPDDKEAEQDEQGERECKEQLRLDEDEGGSVCCLLSWVEGDTLATIAKERGVGSLDDRLFHVCAAVFSFFCLFVLSRRGVTCMLYLFLCLPFSAAL